jgi:hypothetical protein
MVFDGGAEQDRRYYAITTKPQVFVNLVPDHVIRHPTYPIVADRAIVECDWLHAGPGTTTAVASPGAHREPVGAAQPELAVVAHPAGDLVNAGLQVFYQFGNSALVKPKRRAGDANGSDNLPM